MYFTATLINVYMEINIIMLTVAFYVRAVELKNISVHKQENR